ncbi:protocadherin Fat 2-like [Littorina saxatilis]|uniref:protocadherin Fat 2-like n=1 Tax=Littorina saxatilis TaxID=31220 RepID=UPI0038B465D1
MPMARPTWQVCLPNTFLFLWLVTGASQFLEITALPPEFEDVLYVKTLYENEKSRKTIMPLNCTDDDSAYPVVSFNSVTPNSPCGNCFSVLPDEAAGIFNLIYTPNGDTLTAEHTYYVGVTCRAGTDPVVSKIVEIRMIRNSPPYFDPDQSYVYEKVDNTDAKKAGYIVYTVGAKDDDNDTIFYSMTSEPASDNFEIVAGPLGTGIIKAKNDLDSECNQQITFKVMITDHINDPVGPMSVHTTLNGTHTTPEITNLDVAIQVPEDTAVNEPIFTLNPSSNNLEYVFTADPSDGLAFFDIVSNKVKVKKTLDFEDPPTNRPINLTIMAYDKKCWSEKHYLHITVIDVNEAPELYPLNPVYTVYEGSDLYHVDDSLEIPWKIIDEDQYDYHTFSILETSNPQHNFSIDPHTGQLTSNIDWDVDNDNNPGKQTVTVVITDKGGLTNQSDVTIYFKDRNDHAPVITTNNHAWRVCETGRKIGAFMKTMVCEDEDSSFQGNNDTYFEGGNGLINVDGNGRIIMASRPAPGVTYTTTAKCCDQGLWPEPLCSSAVYISITGTDVCEPSSDSPNLDPTTLPATVTTTQPTTTELTTTETPEPTTTAPSNKTSTWLDENLWWLIIAGILGTLLLGLLMYMWLVFCSKYCSQCWSKQWCKSRPAQPRRLKPPPRVKTPPKLRVRTPPRKVAPAEKPKPPTPPPTPPAAIVGPQDGYIYDFWKERYPDDDYANEPERQNNPRPVTPENKPSGGVENSHEPSKNGPIVPPKNKPPASTAKPKSCVVM